MPLSRVKSCCLQMRQFRRWRGVLVVVGGVLVHLSLGTLYTFGNLSPYVTSYMRDHGSSPDLTNTKCSWIFALAAMGQGVSMFLGGLIELKLGPKLTSLLGGWVMSLGVLLTYFTVKHSFALAIITYGLVFGLGVGIAYAIPLGCAVRWFPERKGLVTGLVVAGFGGGAFIFNQVQTAFINPDNLAPVKASGDDEAYFNQPSLLHRVPYVFLLIGACYAVMQLLGSLLLCDPPATEWIYFTEENEGSDLLTTAENVRILSHEATNTADQEVADEKQKPYETIQSENVRPRELLKSKHFYILWFVFLLNGQGITFISSLYKAYGQTFISDDTFLAVVGSFAAVFNAGGRVFWGSLADRFSFRVAMMLVCGSFTCLMLTLQATEYGKEPLFFVYICLLFGSFSGNFALLPTATAKLFGRKHFSLNYGLLFTSQVITNPIGVYMTQNLITTFHYSGMFFLVAGFTFISLILTIVFNAKDASGQEI